MSLMRNASEKLRDRITTKFHDGVVKIDISVDDLTAKMGREAADLAGESSGKIKAAKVSLKKGQKRRADDSGSVPAVKRTRSEALSRTSFKKSDPKAEEKEKDYKGKTCYRCQRKGHIARECTTAAGKIWGAKGKKEDS